MRLQAATQVVLSTVTMKSRIIRQVKLEVAFIDTDTDTKRHKVLPAPTMMTPKAYSASKASSAPVKKVSPIINNLTILISTAAKQVEDDRESRRSDIFSRHRRADPS